MHPSICIFIIVYSECDVNRCENGGECIKQGVSYICNCGSSYRGLFCEESIHGWLNE